MKNIDKKLRWGCGDCTPDNPPFTPKDVATVIVSYGNDYEDCGNRDGFSVVLLNDGRYGVSQEWADSTGHG